MQTRYLYLLKYILPITDLVMLNLVYVLSYYLTEYLGKTVSYELWQHYMVVCNLMWMFNTVIFGLYTDYGSRRLERIYRGTWRSIALHGIGFALYLLFSRDIEFSRTFLVVFYALLVGAFVLNRFLGTAFQFLLVQRFNVNKKVALIGVNPTGRRLAHYLDNQYNIDFYGYLDDGSRIYADENGNLPTRFISKMVAAALSGVKDIYVSLEPHRMSEVKTFLEVADKHCLRVKFIPDMATTLATPYTISYVGDEFPVISLRTEPLESVSNRFKKRAFDIIFSLGVIIFLMSWLYPLIAILIKLQSKGPVLFKQQRSGRNDEPFWCYKFRSMKVNNDSDKKQATKDDNRITPIGKFLRKSSLDELPQFFNVLLGNMSVVGPRPHMLSHTEEYRAIINQFMVRHFLKPGITGWAQVNGFRGETKEDGAMQKRVQHDIWYLENWTAMLEVKIVFMTVINMIKGEDNAY
ncbi:putative colanic acid biosysnthesis UDP-glucose lipid carrier transferase [Pedobacter steynii]|uniref:Putative colanic acid biosysnthesis UDP-glucose lipid carrier transferase n=1 Tax=Pedobacter steynii TaxID=430522 RepID=A0A1G9YED1_9SPHI|nr:undecaprenyl-phosphate glucose phosphotransferase [Pedobacter steynii]NQX39678.1 undecaprenyl-phosphate glucose phosphotransferase [Pedobacter steynii]SDN06835.1 putative colanic acid biosysnthesis UDP-glucose lipid carrier transferase [Pedobacter steynii]